MEKKTFFISTPIYYSSGRLTIGHAYTTIICDIISRYKKLKGYDVFFLTGSDEHGQKVQEKAKEKGLTPKEYTDSLVCKYKDLWELLKIDYSKFIRTTDDYHVESVKKIFSQYIKAGDVYKDGYEGWYCTPCESFFTESQAGENHICPDCGRPLHIEKEESYFFKMNKYEPWLRKYYDEHPLFIEPLSRKNELVSSFLNEGLQDLCVTRTSFDWGVPVVEDPRHVVYVWIDALSNYITALGYGSDDDSLFKKYWHNDENHEIVHFVGKEITRFHCIYWPIMLKALGLEQPTKIFGHGWILMNGGKMSKSKGNVVYPEPIVERYGLDSLRYFSSSCISFGQDGLFTPELFIDNFNADLVNNYGNLVKRSISMVGKYREGMIPCFKENVTEFDAQLEQDCKDAIASYCEHMDKFEVSDAQKVVFDLLSKGNKYIDLTAPWALAKDENKKEELDSVLAHLMHLIRVGTFLLKPVLVETSAKALDAINASDTSFDNLLDSSFLDNKVATNIDALFPRLDSKLEVEFFEEEMKK